MRLEDCPHDGKAHAHSVIFGGKEWVEDLFRGFLGYAGPVSATEISANLPFRVVATITAFSACLVSDAASKAFRIKLESTCCSWIGSPLIGRGVPVNLLRSTTSRDLASGDRNLTLSAT